MRPERAGEADADPRRDAHPHLRRRPEHGPAGHPDRPEPRATRAPANRDRCSVTDGPGGRGAVPVQARDRGTPRRRARAGPGSGDRPAPPRPPARARRAPPRSVRPAALARECVDGAVLTLGCRRRGTASATGRHGRTSG